MSGSLFPSISARLGFAQRKQRSTPVLPLSEKREPERSFGTRLVSPHSSSRDQPVFCPHVTQRRVSSSGAPARLIDSSADLAKALGTRITPERFLKAEKDPIPMKTFADLRPSIQDEFLNSRKYREGIAQWQRFPPLTSILGGFRSGELTVLTGPTGVGKTTFLAEYCVDLAEQGTPTLFASFEMSPVRIAKIMVTQGAREPLWRDDFHDRIPAAMDAFEARSPGLAWFPSEDPRLFAPSPLFRSPAARIFEMMERAVYAHGLAHLVIDNLQFLVGTVAMNMDSGNSYAARFFIQDDLVSRLRRLATASGCHITLVVHPRKEAHGAPDALGRRPPLDIHSIYGGGRATQEADNVLILQHPFKGPDGIWNKYLWIPKNRYTGEVVNEDRLLMSFDRDTLCSAIEDHEAERNSLN